MTRRDLATKAICDDRTLAKAEAGQAVLPSVVQKIARALDIDSEELSLDYEATANIDGDASDGGVTIAVRTERVDFRLRLDAGYSDFGEAKRAAVLAFVKEVLDLDEPPATDFEPGSVQVTVRDLTLEQAGSLMERLDAVGSVAGYDVVVAEVIGRPRSSDRVPGLRERSPHDEIAEPLWQKAQNTLADIASESQRSVRSASRDAPVGPSSKSALLRAANEEIDRMYSDREASDALKGVLAELPQHYREAIELRYFAGLSSDDVGKCLGVSARAARGLCHRARAHLRELID